MRFAEKRFNETLIKAEKERNKGVTYDKLQKRWIDRFGYNHTKNISLFIDHLELEDKRNEARSMFFKDPSGERRFTYSRLNSLLESQRKL